MNRKDINLDILKIAAHELKSLKNDLVYVGGSTISLYITEPEAVTIRETKDIDCIIEASNRSAYEELASKLRKIGFNEDVESKVLCRFKKNDLILDLMPTDPKILGFSNKWYIDGFKYSKLFKVGQE